MTQQKIVPNLWFDTQAEEAARLYTSLFGNARIGATTHYSDAGEEVHRRQPGTCDDGRVRTRRLPVRRSQRRP